MSETPSRIASGEGQPQANTDREIWRRTPGDYYSPSIHVMEGGGIGMDVVGIVIVMPVEEWHRLGMLREREMATIDVERQIGQKIGGLAPRKECVCGYPQPGMQDPTRCQNCGGVYDWEVMKRRQRERATIEMEQKVREIEEGKRCPKCGNKTHPWCLCNEPNRRPDPLEMANVAPKSEVPEEVAEAANHPSAFWLGFAVGAGLVTITGAVAAILLFR